MWSDVSVWFNLRQKFLRHIVFNKMWLPLCNGLRNEKNLFLQWF